MTTTGTSNCGQAERDGPFLSKSKFLWGLQCHKLVWHADNAKDLILDPDASQQAIFDQGHEVGTLAKKLFADGIEVGEGVTDLEDTLRLTQEAIRLRKPLFEAAFAAEGGYCRVDILRPYQQVPFQFSLHIVRTPGARPEHRMFLAEGRGDLRPTFMLRLRETIGTKGSVVAYNAEFEKGRLQECCEVMPNFLPWLAQVERRIVDLLEPFRSFHYYPHQISGEKSRLVAGTPAGRKPVPTSCPRASTCQYTRDGTGE